MEDPNRPTIVAPNNPKGKHKIMTIVLIVAGVIVVVVAIVSIYLSVSSSVRLTKAGFKNSETIAMIKAAESGDVDGVNAAVKAGADPNGFGGDNVTPLMFLLGDTNMNMTGFAAVIAAGADPNLSSTDGLAPITFAARAKDPSVLRAMFKGGGNPNLKDPTGFPLLWLAARDDAWQNVEILLGAGADINAVDGSGYTTVMNVATLDDYEHVYWLIEKGADIKYQDEGASLVTLIELDIKNNVLSANSSQFAWRQKVMDLLKSKGVTIQAVSNTGN